MPTRRILPLALVVVAIVLLATLCRVGRHELDVPAGCDAGVRTESRAQAAPVETTLREPVVMASCTPEVVGPGVAQNTIRSTALVSTTPDQELGMVLRFATHVQDFDVEVEVAAAAFGATEFVSIGSSNISYMPESPHGHEPASER